jgi:alanyl-tRNA synthetase
MKSEEIRKRFLTFFEKRGHVAIPSASLIPENDPTVLFNTAGMQPLVPYLMGAKHPAGTRIVDVQKCLRTGDIDDVGDNTHATFFEMLGNWSLGDYFKQDAIKWSYELLTSKEGGFGLDVKRLYITVFEGDKNTPKDTEAFEIWKKIGIAENRIYFKGADSNWWPAVKDEEKDRWTGPTGPCSEMFYDVTEKGLGDLSKEEYIKADEAQQVVEIWNDVFMEYEKKEGKIVKKLEQKNVDTGAGLERIASILQKKNSIFSTDLFQPIMEKIDELTISTGHETQRSKRIVADHIRSSVFIIADGVIPSNTDRGYILRRLLRRAIRYADKIEMKQGSLSAIAETVIKKYQDIYPNVNTQAESIKKEIDNEETKFRMTLKNGLKEFNKLSLQNTSQNTFQSISGKDAFILFSTYGFPIELTLELAKEKNISTDALLRIKKEFEQEFNTHQELSRKGAEQKFKGGLADTGEMSLKYHTATHLLHQALRDVLGKHVSQKGSNITAERLRFDFSHPMKMTIEEIKKVENIVNQKISEQLEMHSVVMPKAEAEKTGALHFFGEKYGDMVTVHYLGKDISSAYSKEYCGGPHVKNTSELGKFKITKEEAVSSGVRRIKAVLL